MRARVLSGLVGAGLMAVTAGGQEPKAKEKPKANPPKAEQRHQLLLGDVLVHTAAPPAKGSLEEAIRTAMQHNPDVRVAEAEAQLANAKMAQVRAKVTQQVAATRLAVDAAKRGVQVAVAELDAANAALAQTMKLLDVFRKGGNQIAQTEIMQVEAASTGHRAQVARASAQVEAAKAAVANAEAALAGVLGTTPGQTAGTVRVWNSAPHLGIESFGKTVVFDGVLDATAGESFLLGGLKTAAPSGSVADKLTAALDKPVKLAEQKNVGVEKALKAVLTAAGLDVQVRVPLTEDPRVFKEPVRYDLPAAELPLSTWFELIADETAKGLLLLPTDPNQPGPKRYEFYLREYGILVSDPARAPADAVSVSAFVKRARAEKAAREKEGEKAKAAKP